MSAVPGLICIGDGHGGELVRKEPGLPLEPPSRGVDLQARHEPNPGRSGGHAYLAGPFDLDCMDKRYGRFAGREAKSAQTREQSCGMKTLGLDDGIHARFLPLSEALRRVEGHRSRVD